MNNLTEVIKHLRTAQPHMKAMGDALEQYANPKSEYVLLDEALGYALKLENTLLLLSPLFADKQGNLAESWVMATDILVGLKKHKQDVERGLE